MKSVDLPTLFDAVDNPGSLEHLTITELGAMLAQLAALQTRIAGRLAELGASQNGNAHGGDKMLNAKAAADVLRVAPAWLYKRADALPFAVRIGGHLRFSANGIAKFIAARTGTGGRG